MLGFLGGLNLQVIAIIATITISFGAGWTTNGWRLNSEMNREKIATQKAIKDKEDTNQQAVDDLRRKKDADIASINNQLINAISELRQRPSRSDKVSTDGQAVKTCNGSELFSDDAIFLAWFATRTEALKTSLNACYDQYDAIALPSR